MTFEELVKSNIAEQERRESSNLEQLYLELPVPMDLTVTEPTPECVERGYIEIDMG